MFHLLVAFQGWQDSGGTLSNSRVYIKPDEEPGRSFFFNGKLDASRISSIPALLVTETGGNGPQFSRVAHITKVTQGPSETAIQYAIDGSIQPISNRDLEGYSARLGLGKYTLTHTHWRICEADLFKILLLNQQKSDISSKVFSIDSMRSQEANLVSVMMPFRVEFNPVYSALQTAASTVGMNCSRADDIWEHHAVIQDIVNIIARARVVICDCTGKNANVFYETGIAHTLGKEVILVTQSEEDIPFDLRHLRYIRYLSNGEGLRDLSQRVQERLHSLIES